MVLFQLHMLRVSPSMGQVLEMNTTLRHLLFLLEYCMVTGYDWWDVLLHVQPSMVHNLVEKLHEEYMRQNQALLQVHGILGNIYSTRPCSRYKAFWVISTELGPTAGTRHSGYYILNQALQQVHGILGNIY